MHSHGPAQARGSVDSTVEVVVQGAIDHMLHHQQLHLAVLAVAQQVHQASAEQLGQDLDLVFKCVLVVPETRTWRGSLHGHDVPVLERSSEDEAMAGLHNEVFIRKATGGGFQVLEFEHLKIAAFLLYRLGQISGVADGDRRLAFT